VFLPEISLRGVYNEIPNIMKLYEALPTQVFKVVVKSSQRAKGWQRAGKGHILFLDQTTNGTLEAQKAECPQ